MEPLHFANPAEWRAWLEANHDRETEVLVVLPKRGSARPGMTWPQLVDEALCFGWIDGVRRGIGDDAYTIRVTPRKPTSNWSAYNVKRFEELREAGRVTGAGEAAFARRRADRTAIYSYEQEAAAELSPGQEERLRSNPAAWEFFSGQPPWYRRTATHWVMRAKREETRERRLAQLVEDSANGLRVKPLRR